MLEGDTLLLCVSPVALVICDVYLVSHDKRFLREHTMH